MPDKKPEAAAKDYKAEIIYLLVGLFLVAIIADRAVEYWYAAESGFIRTIWGNIVYFLAAYFWPILKVLAVLVSFGSVVGIIHSYRKLVNIIKEENQVYSSPSVDFSGDVGELGKNKNWERVIELINSASESDWRLAIIEADVILEDMMRRAGYSGDSLGEMLKSVEKSDFLTIDQAWEAHKIRNSVAHRGGDFPLNEREAKHAINLFENVFKEFNII